jgi:hypothetical protein
MAFFRSAGGAAVSDINSEIAQTLFESPYEASPTLAISFAHSPFQESSVETYFDYLRAMSHQLGERIVQTYPALQTPKDAPAAALKTLLRKPLPAQALAITGLAKYLKAARSARIVAECGAGKTYMSLGTMHVHAGAKSYTTLVMCPPHIVHKWAREALLTVPHTRAFIVEDLRNGGDPKNSHGIVEVKLERGQTVVRGIATTLPQLRSMRTQGMEGEVPAARILHHGQGEGQTRLLLEARLCRSKVRT